MITTAMSQLISQSKASATIGVATACRLQQRTLIRQVGDRRSLDSGKGRQPVQLVAGLRQNVNCYRVSASRDLLRACFRGPLRDSALAAQPVRASGGGSDGAP